MNKKKKQNRKQSFGEWLKTWDEGNFDFTAETMGPLHKKVQVESDEDHTWSHTHLKGLERREMRAFDKVYPYLSTILTVILIVFLLLVVKEMPVFGLADTPANNSEVVRRYIEEGLTETGAVNIVAGVILDYRAFDTLGESHVLFTAASCVFILLVGTMRPQEREYSASVTQSDLLLKKTALVLMPLILMFGCYVILNGHIGPGGGFSGGAIMGAGMILYGMAFGQETMRKLVTLKRYRIIVLSALVFYSCAKCYSFFCGANGLHTIFTTGTPGMIFSAGLILPLNIAVGIVVAFTMYGFYCLFTRGSI